MASKHFADFLLRMPKRGATIQLTVNLVELLPWKYLRRMDHEQFVKVTIAKMNKYLGDSRKSKTARYQQLKSGHAVTGIHLFRMKKAQDARCWWCNGSSQSVTYLMFECRKWRRERESMLRAISPKKTKISARMDTEDLGIMFGDASIEIVAVHRMHGSRQEKRGGWCATN